MNPLTLPDLTQLPPWLAARPQVQWLFFDIDGTLFRPEAICRLFADVACTQGISVTPAEVCAWLGRTRIQQPETLLETILAGKGLGLVQAEGLVAAYAAAFLQLPADYFTPFVYPDVVPAFDTLRGMGVRIGIISNRFEAQGWHQLRASPLGAYLAAHPAYRASEGRVLSGGDSPAPTAGEWSTVKGRQLALHMERLGIAPRQALVVGDVPESDLAAAREAAMWGCLLRRES